MSHATGIAANDLAEFAQSILEAVGVDSEAAETVASSLVDADLEGFSSHGVMLLPMYVDRIRSGSVRPNARPETVVDSAATAVIDAHHGLGQIAGDFAMDLAIGKADEFGIGIVAVRHGFHFGMARRFALAAAERGCIGLVSSNTRPLMPAPGGAEPIVGNNPLAIALPVAGETPLVLDLALSEVAMGKIRIAAQNNESIPEGWATDSSGTPTTDAAEAVGGMLLPAGGHKGFGLALMLDLISGLLSSGAWGDGVTPLYGDSAVPYDASHVYIAINVEHFRTRQGFETEAERAAMRVRESALAPGHERVFTPGQRAWERRATAAGRVSISDGVAEALTDLAEGLGVPVPGWTSPDNKEN